MACGVFANGYVVLFLFLLKETKLCAGDVLISSGDDGKIRTWKRSYEVSNGTAEWIEYSVVGTRNGQSENDDGY